MGIAGAVGGELAHDARGAVHHPRLAESGHAAVLSDAGVIAQPRALLEGSRDDGAVRLDRIRAQLRSAHEIDRAAYSARTRELAYLANAIVAGCSVQARPFTAREGSDAASAICNLGLENWPARWLENERRSLPDNFLVTHDLVSAFQVGWTVLYDEVCMYAAGRLIDALADLPSDDEGTQSGLVELRVAMTRAWRAGTPWRARDDLDAVATLDMLVWSALVGLIDECPVMPAVLAARPTASRRSIDPAAFEFISENSQIQSIRAFLGSLGEALRS